MTRTAVAYSLLQNVAAGHIYADWSLDQKMAKE